jgi:hypothetical protein
MAKLKDKQKEENCECKNSSCNVKVLELTERVVKLEKDNKKQNKQDA